MVAFFAGDGAGTVVAERWDPHGRTRRRTSRSITAPRWAAGRSAWRGWSSTRPRASTSRWLQLGAAPWRRSHPVRLQPRRAGEAWPAGHPPRPRRLRDRQQQRSSVTTSGCAGSRTASTTSTRRWLRLGFDPPPDCTELKGVGGEGDSGGPALMATPAGLRIAGVSSVAGPRRRARRLWLSRAASPACRPTPPGIRDTCSS